ncbi:hypothetical protein DLH72_02130 [Candidatus Gracilibacteria bacterium]|nr:MAG: hypothetical protein DLH72_02130 [Candidatus Gracilibacteria bacterium]
MRTIEKILKYNFSEKQIEEYKKSGIINGCGGKGGVDFSEIIEIFFKKFQNFKNEKLEKLWSDIEQLCYEHDYDFYIQKGFKKSNFDFAKGVFRLIKSWTSFFERFIIFLIIYFLLNKYGKKYYDSKKIKLARN